MLHRILAGVFALTAAVIVSSCTSTEIIESPKTVYVPETAEVKQPEVIWTSRTLTRHFDYLGIVKVRSFTYDGAIDRLVEGAKELRADAVIDVHFGRVGFLNAMEAFAVKFK